MATISRALCVIGISLGPLLMLDKHLLHSPIAYRHPVILNRVLHLGFVHLLHLVEYRPKSGAKTMTRRLFSKAITARPSAINGHCILPNRLSLLKAKRLLGLGKVRVSFDRIRTKRRTSV